MEAEQNATTAEKIVPHKICIPKVLTYIPAHTYIHTYVHVHVYIHVHVCTHVYILRYACLHIYVSHAGCNSVVQSSRSPPSFFL